MICSPWLITYSWWLITYSDSWHIVRDSSYVARHEIHESRTTNKSRISTTNISHKNLLHVQISHAYYKLVTNFCILQTCHKHLQMSPASFSRKSASRTRMRHVMHMRKEKIDRYKYLSRKTDWCVCIWRESLIDVYVSEERVPEERERDAYVPEERVRQIYMRVRQIYMSQQRDRQMYVSQQRDRQMYTSQQRDRQVYMSLQRESLQRDSLMCMSLKTVSDRSVCL